MTAFTPPLTPMTPREAEVVAEMAAHEAALNRLKEELATLRAEYTRVVEEMDTLKATPTRPSGVVHRALYDQVAADLAATLKALREQNAEVIRLHHAATANEERWEREIRARASERDAARAEVERLTRERELLDLRAYDAEQHSSAFFADAKRSETQVTKLQEENERLRKLVFNPITTTDKLLAAEMEHYRKLFNQRTAQLETCESALKVARQYISDVVKLRNPTMGARMAGDEIDEILKGVKE